MKKITKRILKKLGLLSTPYQAMPGSIIDDLSLVGKHTYIGYNCSITKATVGSYCSIANNVSVGPGEHDIELVSSNSIFYNNPYEKLTQKSVHIGHDVWLGVNSVIRRGVRIGNGAVIGANSFVNSDVPAYSIYAGTPAKFLKMRFNPEEIVKIEKSLWWNFAPEEARKIVAGLDIDSSRKFENSPTP